MFALADVLEQIDDRLDERAFAQQEVTGELDESVAHAHAQLGDEAQALVEEEALS